jgi:hypothetical protein
MVGEPRQFLNSSTSVRCKYVAEVTRFPLNRDAHRLQLHVETPGRAFLLEEVVDLDGFHETVAAGDDEGDPPPAEAGDGRQLVLQGAELQLIIPLARPRVIRLGGDQVAAGDQLVALDRRIMVDRPAVFAEIFGVVLDTNNKTDLPRVCGALR